MTTFTYNCKKTGQTLDIEIESLPGVSVEYAIRRGLREYFDNYHASETMKAHDGDAAKLAAAVAPLVDEARDRLMVGDVPGTRGPADPKAAAVRKLVAAINAGTSPEELLAMARTAVETPSPAAVVVAESAAKKTRKH